MKSSGRIEIQGYGVGEMSQSDIERRAQEIAARDGRSEPGDHDRFRARQELEHPGIPPAPETENMTEPVTQWGKAPGSKGTQAQKPASEQLIEEGLEEADSDQRLSASQAYPAEEA